MAKKTFSLTTKKAAVAAMGAGELTQKQIAEKYGCSIAALSLWRRELQTDEPAVEETWDEETTPEPVKPCKSKNKSKCECECETPGSEAKEIMRKFWSKNNRAVDMLFTPKEMSADEVFKFVNEAIQFAHDSKK